MVNIERILLPNGLKLILAYLPNSNSITVQVGVGAGSRYEDRNNRGIAHFFEHMLFEGTNKFPNSMTLSSFIENIGGRGWAVTNKDSVVYSARVPLGCLRYAFEYLHEILFNSLLKIKSINKEKEIIIEELHSREDNASEYIWDVWFNETWGNNHSLGRTNTGSEKEILAITRGKLIKHLNMYYFPKNMVLVVSGNFSKFEAKKYSKYYFSQPKKVEIPKYNKATIVNANHYVKVVSRDIQQIQFILGFVTGVSYTHEDRYPFQILSTLLGEGASSRLVQSLLYKNGFAYNISAEDWPLTDTGFFCIYGAVRQSKLDNAIGIICNELRELRRRNISMQELQAAKEKYKATIMFLCESTDALAEYITQQELLEERSLSLKDLSIEIDRISKSNIKRISGKYFNPENLRLALVGPVDEGLVSKITKKIQRNL